MKEYLLSVNSVNQPTVLESKDATYVLLTRLILCEKGTFVTHPDMGVGIVSRYRFSTSDELEALRTDITEQVSTYLPDLIATDITVTEDTTNRIIDIQITVDSITYSFTFDKTTKTLSDL